MFLSAARLLVGLVASNSLAAVKIRVDTGVELVQEVAVVRSGSLVGVATADSVTTVSASGSAKATSSTVAGGAVTSGAVAGQTASGA